MSQCLCPRLSCPVRPSVWRQWHWSVMEGLLHQASCIQLLQPLVAMYPPMSNKITCWIPLSGDLPMWIRNTSKFYACIFLKKNLCSVSKVWFFSYLHATKKDRIIDKYIIIYGTLVSHHRYMNIRFLPHTHYNRNWGPEFYQKIYPREAIK